MANARPNLVGRDNGMSSQATLFTSKTSDQPNAQTYFESENWNASKKPRRFCCGIFKSRKSCCLVVLPLILLTLVLLGYFLWPRYPTLVFSPPFAATSSLPTIETSAASLQGDALRTSLSQATPETPFFIRFPLSATVYIYSPNYIDIATNSIDIKAFYTFQGVQHKSLSINGTIDNIIFRSHTNTSFTLPFDVTYATTTPTINDPALFALATQCTTSSTQTKMSFHYSTDVSITLVSWTGFVPHFEGDMNVECPSNYAPLLTGLVAFLTQPS